MPGHYLAIHLAVLLVLGTVTAVLAKRSRRVGLIWLSAVVVFGMGVQLAVVVFARELANALAWSDAFFFHQFTVHVAGVVVVATPLLQKTRATRIRGGLLAGCLLALAVYASRTVFVAPGPLVDELVETKPNQPVLVRQTETATCAPAAAATLLRALGIDRDASERDLAALSFTHPVQGTTDLGLYRGLRLAAPGRSVRFKTRTLDEIRALAPCLIFVGLDRDRVPDEQTYAFLSDQCNWREGEVHAVVCFGFGRDQNAEGQAWDVAVIGDPNYGVERWSLEHFRYLWDGTTVEVQ